MLPGRAEGCEGHRHGRESGESAPVQAARPGEPADGVGCGGD